MKKVNIEKTELEELWKNAELSIKDIADHFGVSDVTLRKYAKQYGLGKRGKRKSHQAILFSEEELYDLYIVQDKSTQEIAQEYNTTSPTVYNYLKRFGIAVKQKQSQETFAPDFDEFYELFKVQKRPIDELVEHYGVSKSTIYHYSQKHGIARTKQEGREAAKITLQKKYGVDSVMQVPEFKEKAKQTSLNKYGTENPGQSEEVRRKIKQTNLERYGSASPFSSAEVREKRKNTMIERYGTEFPLAVDDFLEKSKQTKITKYGTLGMTEETKHKNKEKYGVEYPLQSPEIRKKAQDTLTERTGYDNPFCNPAVQSQIKKTMMEKYGAEYVLQTPHGRQKINETCQEKYGVDWPMQSSEHQRAMHEAQRKKNNGRTHGQKDIEHYDEWERFSEYCERKFAATGEKLSRAEEARYFNVSHSIISLYIKKEGLYDLFQRSTESDAENFWKEWMVDSGIPVDESARHNLIYPYEIDIPVPSLGIGIEVNPTFFHNSTANPIGEPKSINYHQKKAKLAEEKGINLIQIFDWYEIDKIKNIILSQCGANDRIYARNTSVRLITFRHDEKTFLEENHLQGYVKSEVCYGLYYDFEDEEPPKMVALMSFGKPRYNNKEDAEWEMLRFCTLSGYTIVGGASKLFKHFVRDYNPESIMSFANYDISNGKLYEKLGFDFIRYSSPSYMWSNMHGTEFYSWYLINSKGFDNVFGTNHGKGTSNDELMMDAGFVKVYNSGNKVYLWTKNE